MKASSKEHLKELIQRYPDLAACEADLEQAAETMIDCYRQGGKVMVCGNGGSAAGQCAVCRGRGQGVGNQGDWPRRTDWWENGPVV